MGVRLANQSSQVRSPLGSPMELLLGRELRPALTCPAVIAAVILGRHLLAPPMGILDLKC